MKSNKVGLCCVCLFGHKCFVIMKSSFLSTKLQQPRNYANGKLKLSVIWTGLWYNESTVHLIHSVGRKLLLFILHEYFVVILVIY
jgi:hypothetical protein